MRLLSPFKRLPRRPPPAATAPVRDIAIEGQPAAGAGYEPELVDVLEADVLSAIASVRAAAGEAARETENGGARSHPDLRSCL